MITFAKHGKIMQKFNRKENRSSMKFKSTFYALAAIAAVLGLAGCQPATQRHTPPPAGTPAAAPSDVSRSDPGAFQRTSPPPFSP
jgi:hypothetical protein